MTEPKPLVIIEVDNDSPPTIIETFNGRLRVSQHMSCISLTRQQARDLIDVSTQWLEATNEG